MRWGARLVSYRGPVKLAWFAPSQDVAVAGTWGELRDLAAPSNDAGVAWWIGDRHEPTVAEGRSRLEFLRRHNVSPYAFTSLEPQPRLSIERMWLDSVDVQLLISQLNLDLYSRYPEPGALIFSLESGDIVDGVGALLMAELDGEPVGCGAFRIIDDLPGSAEIKRMYVTLAGRGKKIGSALLAELERLGAANGVRRFALETGPRQPEALQVFSAAGYVACEPWGPFVGKDLSVCMEKADTSR
jgi:GNAT superfamily N-acetyltransferase